MRLSHGALVLCVLCLTGCGYVGPVLPPSPEIPGAVADLRVIEKGDQLDITFTVPPRTIDSLVIKRYTAIDLAIGSAETPFDFDKWAATAQHFELPLPAIDPDAPSPKPVSQALPATDWIGKHVVVAVRTSTRKEDHFSQWSNRALVDVISPIEAPVATIEATKKGYLLTWPDEGEGVHYLIFRRGPADKAPVQVGTADHPPYLDNTSQWSTPYVYTVVAQQGTAESQASKELAVNHADTFAPEVPASITALAGPESVEVTWSRSPDTDLKGYYVYRSTNGGDFVRQGNLITVPTFSDRNVERGKAYRYEISAVNQNGYESDKSAPSTPVAF